MIGAVDIGGTKIAAGVVDEAGKILFSREFATAPVKNDPGEGVRRIASIFQEAGLALEGIGIGCTGPVYPESGSLGVIEFLPGWTDLNLVPAAIDNDANAAALGEWAWGAGRGVERFMMVTVGTGIGVGVVLHGKVYHGAGGAHPEMGHHVILDGEGPQCFCGARGCWESLASGTALERWVEENSPFKTHLTGRQLCELAVTGDEFACKAVHRTAHYLGVGLSNLITLWMPDQICLSGGLMKARDLFLPEIRRVIAQNCGLVPYERTALVEPQLGGDAGMVGAAQVWLQTRG
jgi:glucokinase